MRKGTQRFIVHSICSFFDYKAYHRIKNYFWVRFLVKAQVYEKLIDQPYERELGWGAWGHVKRFASVIFNWNLYGFVASPFIITVILSFIFVNFPPILLIGVFSGWGVNTLVYYMQRDGKWIPKQKKVWVTKERFMAPQESEWIIDDVYEIIGREMKTVETLEGAKQSVPTEFKRKAVGYDELYDIRNDERYQIESFRVVDQVKRRRTATEMKNLKRTYLARNREIVEQVFSLKKLNASLRKKLLNSIEEKESIKEEHQTEIVDTVTKMKMARKKRGNTLIKILEDEFGEAFVRNNLDASVERAERIIQEERDRAKADQMQELINLMYKLIDMVGSKAELRTESLRNLITLKEEMDAKNDSGNGSR